MTFDANVPDTNQSPGLFPAQGSTNFTRIKANFNTEHVFNDSAAVTDGVHRQMTVINRANPVALPAGTNGMLYFNSNRPKGYDGIATYFLPPCVAAVTFNNTGIISGNATNVTSVTKNGTGDFTITFTTAIPSTNGQFNCSSFSHNVAQLQVCGLTVFTTANARVLIKDAATGTTVDPSLCSVQFFYGY